MRGGWGEGEDRYGNMGILMYEESAAIGNALETVSSQAVRPLTSGRRLAREVKREKIKKDQQSARDENFKKSDFRLSPEKSFLSCLLGTFLLNAIMRYLRFSLLALARFVRKLLSSQIISQQNGLQLSLSNLRSLLRTSISPNLSAETILCVSTGRMISTVLTILMKEGFDVKALRAFRVLRPLRLVSGVPSKSLSK